jgi:hypothetical protein
MGVLTNPIKSWVIAFQSNSLLREYLYALLLRRLRGIYVSIQLPIKGVFILFDTIRKHRH